jgi:hypothetical protein
MVFVMDVGVPSDVIPEAEPREAIGDPAAHGPLELGAGFPLSRE